MHFAILFEDDPDAPTDIRKKLMPQHLEFLKRNEKKILSAGPLVGDDRRVEGGLWLVSAAGREIAEDLVREDPFWPTGLRKKVRILEWRRVFADGQALVPPTGS